MKKYRIGAVCGAGFATSSVVATKLRDELSKRGINADVVTLKVLDVGSASDSFDLLVTSTLLKADVGIPIIRGISLLTGIGEEETIEEIVSTLRNMEKK
jgi:PTS system galactitol-specific IIB component